MKLLAKRQLANHIKSTLEARVLLICAVHLRIVSFPGFMDAIG